ncbi:hypothetical protein D3C72_1910250 [compost metagenome]
MREDTLFHANHKDDGELKPFGGMQRHQRHLLFSFSCIGARHQSNFLKELRQAGEALCV